MELAPPVSISFSPMEDILAVACSSRFVECLNVRKRTRQVIDVMDTDAQFEIHGVAIDRGSRLFIGMFGTHLPILIAEV